MERDADYKKRVAHVEVFTRRMVVGCLTVSCACSLFIGGCRTKPNGDMKVSYVHKYGVAVADKEDWESRGGNGEIQKKLKNGITISEPYTNNVLDGDVTETFPHTEVLQRRSHYDQGILTSDVLYYRSGFPKEKKQFQKDTIEITDWYEDGSLRAKETRKIHVRASLLLQGEYFTPDGVLESRVVDSKGVRTIRDALGYLIAKETVLDGMLVGAELYHPCGTPKMRIPYKSGQVDGVKKIFTAGGEPERFEEWKAGVLDGIVILFENGEKVSEIPYKNGKKEGKEVHFKPGTNQVVEEIAWKEDEKHGPTVVIFEEEPITTWYYEGKKVGQQQFRDMNAYAFPGSDTTH